MDGDLDLDEMEPERSEALLERAESDRSRGRFLISSDWGAFAGFFFTSSSGSTNQLVLEMLILQPKCCQLNELETDSANTL